MTMNCRVSDLKPFGVVVEPLHENSPVRFVPVDFLRDLARHHHLVVLRGFSTFEGADAFADYCAQWGEISVWPFGKVLELIEQKNPQDHIFDNKYVPLHWDGMYRPQVPEFQMFHCVRALKSDQGGRTTFSNTKAALQRIDPETRNRWEKITGVYRRKTEHYDSHTEAPLITAHPGKGFPVIRYNEPPRAGDKSFLNHPSLAFRGIDESEHTEFHRSLCEALYDSQCFYAHAWQTGDVLISDNYTLLHGREAFTKGAPRHLRRVHVLGDPALNNPHLVSHA